MKSRYLIDIIKTSALSLVILAACSKKDGVPDSRERIDQVVAEETMTMGEAQLYHYDSHVSEKWNWDGNQPYRIDYFDNKPCSENFFYDGRKIVRTTIPAYRIHNEFIYDGQKLERIDCFRDDTLVSCMRFYHTGKKITRIKWSLYSDTPGETSRFSPLRWLAGSPMAMTMERHNADILKRSNAKSIDTATATYTLSWNGDNVSRIVCKEGNSEEAVWQADMTYDDKRNPYRNLFGYNEFNDELFSFDMMSANNILTISMPSDHSDSQLYRYSYKYDGKYPSERTLTYSYIGVDQSTWSETTFSFTRTESFIYQ